MIIVDLDHAERNVAERAGIVQMIWNDGWVAIKLEGGSFDWQLVCL